MSKIFSLFQKQKKMKNSRQRKLQILDKKRKKKSILSYFFGGRGISAQHQGKDYPISMIFPFMFADINILISGESP